MLPLITIYRTLYAKGTTDILVSPTIAAGDFMISKDGGAFAQLATLPVVSPAGSAQVKFELSLAESEALSATIIGIDQAGSEWEDIFIDVPITEETTLHFLGHLEKSVWVDTEDPVNGDGTQSSPFNSLNDAIDDAESHGFKSLVVYSDITLDRNLKNFSITGVGTPTIDANGQDLNKSEFRRVRLQGTYVGNISATQCLLLNGFRLSGGFDECRLAGDLICEDGSVVLMVHCVSAIPGTSRPTISMNATGTALLSIRGYSGGMTIKDCNQITDAVTAEISEGSLTFDSSCTAGDMVARGGCKFVDETTGATVTDDTVPNLTWLHRKALSVAKFLGLK